MSDIYGYLRDWGSSLDAMRVEFARVVKMEYRLGHLSVQDTLRLLRLAGHETYYGQ